MVVVLENLALVVGQCVAPRLLAIWLFVVDREAQHDLRANRTSVMVRCFDSMGRALSKTEQKLVEAEPNSATEWRHSSVLETFLRLNLLSHKRSIKVRNIPAAKLALRHEKNTRTAAIALY